MNRDIIAKAAEIVEENSVHDREAGFGICTLSLIDEDGFPTVSIITPSKSDGINWIAFGTILDENRTKRIKDCNRANVRFGTAEY